MKPENLSAFGARLLEAFGDVSENVIADVMQIDVSELPKYLESDLPSAEQLTQISAFTGFSIHWLITGAGEKLVEPDSENFAVIPAENIKNDREKNNNGSPSLK